jgi:hypothetical protein
MSKKRVPTWVLIVGFAASAAAARAADPWEFGAFTGGDDGSFTANTLSHGDVQQHDLDEQGAGVDDQDWMRVATIARHSYEGRISGTNVYFGSCGSCAFWDRVDSVGTVITPSTTVSASGGFERTVNWIATATVQEFLRASGDQLVVDQATDVYTVRAWDTTYSIPRWNNSNGQVTVFLISNLTDRTVTGQIDFYNLAGTLLFTRLMTIAPNSLHTFNTSTEPLLAGLAGHAYVAHDAGYGGLAGKAVALEPATGFSFDTLLMPFLI